VESPKWKINPFVSHIRQLKDLMAMGNISYGALVYEVIGGDEPMVQFNLRMEKGDREEQLRILEERATTFLSAKDKKDPGLARHVFFDRDLRWLCHRIDRRTGEDVWCPYYWKCMQLIVKEKPELDPAAQNVLEKEPSIQSSPSIDVKVREAIQNAN
jgi:hypothetical protein